MERLTFEGNFCDIAQCRELPCPYNGACSQRKVWELLKAYEDTGLTPERCAEFARADAEGRYSVMRNAEQEGVARLRELAEADKDGRLVVQPCKVGDELWTNIAVRGDRYRLSDRPYRVKVVFIGLGGNKPAFFHVEYSNGRVFPFDAEQFGKTIFRTREEAEKALEV